MMMGANLIVVGMVLCVCRMKHLLIETEDPGDGDREPGQDYSEDSYHYHDDYNAVSKYHNCQIFSRTYYRKIFPI